MSPSLLAPVVDPQGVVATVRAVFEHAGFMVTVPADRPKGIDLLAYAPGTAEPLAVRCVTDPSLLSAELLTGILENCRARGVARVQILCPLRCPTELHAVAAQAHAELVDGEQFAAALRTLPPANEAGKADAAAPLPSFMVPELSQDRIPPQSPPPLPLPLPPSAAFAPATTPGQHTGQNRPAYPVPSRWGSSWIAGGLGLVLLIAAWGLASVFVPGSGKPVPVAKPAQENGGRASTDAGTGSAESTEMPQAAPSPEAPSSAAGEPIQPVSGLEVDFAPIRIPADAATSASEVKPEFVRDLRRTADLDRIDDAKVSEFATFLIESGGQFGRVDVERLRPAAEEVLRQAERFPMLAYYAVPCARDQPAAMEALLPLLEKAGDAVKTYHGRSLWAYHTRRREDAEAALLSLQSMLRETNGLQGLSAPAAINALFHPYAKGFWSRHHGEIATILQDTAEVDLWFKELVRGEHYFLAAREVRSRAAGDASSVYISLLRQADECCERSWTAKPHPRSAALLIAVCQDVSEKPKEEMRIWFDAAVSLRADYHAAYRTYLEGLQPSHHGSDAELAAFGKACLNTGRFDLGVPDHLLEAHRLRAKARGAVHWGSLGQEEISDLEALFRGFEVSERDASSRAWDRSIAAAVWFAAGQEEKLVDSLRLLNFEVDPGALQWIGMPQQEFAGAVAKVLAKGERASL